MRPDATETGTFERLPCSQLLVRALDQRWSGALFVDPPQNPPHVVQLDGGLPVRARAPGDEDYARLGALVVESGVVMQAEVDLALRPPEQAGSELLGQALVGTGTVDPGAIEHLLRAQLLARLVRLFALPAETAYAFCAGHDAFAGFRGTPLRIDPLRVLWAGLSVHGERSQAMAAVLEPLGDRPLYLRSEGKIERFGFDETAMAVVRELQRGPCSLAELRARGLASEPRCQRAVYALRVCRFLARSLDAPRSTTPPPSGP